MGSNPKQILISFIGSNDAGDLSNLPDGAILTALINQKFNQVILIWNRGNLNKINYSLIADYLEKEIKHRKLAKKVELYELKIKDVTDHNEIYKTLKSFTDGLDKSKQNKYTAAISSGTPAMQVSWILLAESGDFSESNPLNLIKVKDPKFGKSANVPVKIDTSLPRIIKMRGELDTLKEDLIPQCIITISRPGLKIRDTLIELSPMELSYYKYFVDKVLNEQGLERFSGYNTTNKFLDSILEIHKQFYPDLDSNRMDLEKIRRDGVGLSLNTFRGNISKTNKKLKAQLDNDTVYSTYEIKITGSRGAKCYGISAPTSKFTIKK